MLDVIAFIVCVLMTVGCYGAAWSVEGANDGWDSSHLYFIGHVFLILSIIQGFQV